MRQAQLGMFIAALAAWVVCSCILTRKPKRTLPILRVAVPDERQPHCFALEEEWGSNWKGGGRTVPSVKEAKPSL